MHTEGVYVNKFTNSSSHTAKIPLLANKKINSRNLFPRRKSFSTTRVTKDKCHKLSVYYTNCRSLCNKMDELRAIASTDRPDIIALTETWINTDKRNFIAEFHIQGYNMFKTDRIDRRGGGVAIYIKDKIKACIRSDIKNNNNTETIWVEIGEERDSLVIGVIYRPPNLNRDDSKLLWSEINKASQSNKVCIVGDINYPNIDWTYQIGDNESDEFLEVVLDNFLIQYVNSPTRGNNILDLVFSNKDNIISNVEISSELGNSDHKSITFNLLYSSKFHENKTLIPDFRKADFDGLRKGLEIISTRDFPRSSENGQGNYLGVNIQREDYFNLDYKSFTETIIKTQVKYIPKKKYRSVNDDPKWINNGLKDVISKKKGIYRKINRGQTHLTQYFVEISRIVKREVRKSKRNYEKRVAKNSKTNPKEFFQMYKSKVKDAIGPIKTETGHTDVELDMCKLLNNQFLSVFTNEDTTQFPQVQELFSDGPDNILNTISISRKDVIREIDKLKSHKSPGPDEIYARVLKECKEELGTPLTSLFNRSIESGLVPDDWKLANVIPIFKKGDKSDPSNYRPISLTSIVGKLLESIIAGKIRDHLEKYSLINPSQHGFLKGRSCLTNLLSFFSRVYEAVDKDKAYDIVYLDFSKAFDRVPHLRLLKKVEAHGIGGQLLKWIRSWLIGRKQRVVINGVRSDWGMVKSGVPQGSVLGPLLFIIYINDIDIGITSRISKFADDTKIGRVIETDIDIAALQKDLDNLNEWSDKWQMKFNVDKCRVLNIGKPQIVANYSIGNIQIGKSDCEKDLGVLVSNDLKSRKQCINVRNKANRVLGFISRSVSNRTSEVILKLYLALVRPHLDYAVQFWCPHYRMDINLLESVQRRMTKMICNIRNLPYDERLKKLGLHSLERRRTRGDMIEVFKWSKGFNKSDITEVLKLSENDRTRTNGFKLDKFRFRKDIGKHWFGNRVVDMWNVLPNSVISSETIECFKRRLDAHMDELGWV